MTYEPPKHESISNLNDVLPDPAFYLIGGVSSLDGDFVAIGEGRYSSGDATVRICNITNFSEKQRERLPHGSKVIDEPSTVFKELPNGNIVEGPTLLTVLSDRLKEL